MGSCSLVSGVGQWEDIWLPLAGWQLTGLCCDIVEVWCVAISVTITPPHCSIVCYCPRLFITSDYVTV